MSSYNITDQNKVKRAPKRGHYDQATIYEILDDAMIAHIGILHHNKPVVIPTTFGRIGNQLYFHGANASRLLLNMEQGVDVSICITHLDGLVLARSAFHHSMNYRSVVVFGQASLVSDELKKLEALKCISDQLVPGRWEEVRPPSDKELKATKVLQLEISEASAKIRTGPPVDDPADYELDIWAGVLPVQPQWMPVENDPKLRPDIETDESVKAFYTNATDATRQKTL